MLSTNLASVTSNESAGDESAGDGAGTTRRPRGAVRDGLVAAVCSAAMGEFAARIAAGVSRVRGKYGDPAAARRRLRAIGQAYLRFAREQPGLFATAFALPHQHSYRTADTTAQPHPAPLDQLRAVLD